jgi:hypothetical protein
LPSNINIGIVLVFSFPDEKSWPGVRGCLMSRKQVGGRKGTLYVILPFLIVFTSFRIWSVTERQSLTSNDEKELVLLTSFWAQRATVHPHEIEVKGAILANLMNPRLAEIRIVLEGTTPDYGCDDFTAELRKFLNFKDKEPAAQLKCTAWKGDHQPTYYDLFSFSKQVDLSDKIVILSNADMVFDESIAALRSLELSSMVVIATSGLDQSRTPNVVLSYFETFTRLPLKHVVSRCYEDNIPRTSWDAYVFHPGSLNLFQQDFTDVKSGEIFNMNRNGAENAALEAVSRHSAFSQFSQICDHVNMWHFHTTSKMHKNEIGVKHNQLNPESCTTYVKDCLTPGHLSWTIRDVADLT